jgi:UDPglucose 6-dehydrogenase
MPIVTAAREVNRRQRERVIEKLLTHLKILKGRTIGLLGLAFKPDTDDLRDAPAIDLARRLLARGARVIAHDPVAMNRFGAECADLNVSLCESPEDVVRKSDAVVLVTEWHQYQEIQWEALAAAMEHKRVIVLDGRQELDEAGWIPLPQYCGPHSNARWVRKRT